MGKNCCCYNFILEELQNLDQPYILTPNFNCQPQSDICSDLYKCFNDYTNQRKYEVTGNMKFFLFKKIKQKIECFRNATRFLLLKILNLNLTNMVGNQQDVTSFYQSKVNKRSFSWKFLEAHGFFQNMFLLENSWKFDLMHYINFYIVKNL